MYERGMPSFSIAGSTRACDQLGLVPCAAMGSGLPGNFATDSVSVHDLPRGSGAGWAHVPPREAFKPALSMS